MIEIEKILEKYKTGKKIEVEAEVIGVVPAQKIKILEDVYEIHFFDYMDLVFSLKEKQKFYKSIIGRLFYSGDYNLFLINKLLSVLKENTNHGLVFSITYWQRYKKRVIYFNEFYTTSFTYN